MVSITWLTFDSTSEPEFRKPSTSAFSKSRLAELTAIRIELTKVSNNLKLMTYLEMRQIRLKYKNCLYSSPVSTAERQEVKAINKIFKSLKSSHPELVSRKDFKLSQHRHAAKDESTGESSFYNASQSDISKNLMSSFVERSEEAAQQAKEKAASKIRIVTTMEELQQLDEKDRLELCKRWSIELHQKITEEAKN